MCARMKSQYKAWQLVSETAGSPPEINFRSLVDNKERILYMSGKLKNDTARKDFQEWEVTGL